jgi:hypothetical protein
MPIVSCQAAAQAKYGATGPVAERLRVREIDDDESQRLLRIMRGNLGFVRSGSGEMGSSVSWES